MSKMRSGSFDQLVGGPSWRTRHLSWDQAGLHAGEPTPPDDWELAWSRLREQQVLLLRAVGRGADRTQKLP